MVFTRSERDLNPLSLNRILVAPDICFIPALGPQHATLFLLKSSGPETLDAAEISRLGRGVRAATQPDAVRKTGAKEKAAPGDIRLKLFTQTNVALAGYIAGFSGSRYQAYDSLPPMVSMLVECEEWGKARSKLVNGDSAHSGHWTTRALADTERSLLQDSTTISRWLGTMHAVALKLDEEALLVDIHTQAGRGVSTGFLCGRALGANSKNPQLDEYLKYLDDMKKQAGATELVAAELALFSWAMSMESCYLYGRNADPTITTQISKPAVPQRSKPSLTVVDSAPAPTLDRTAEAAGAMMELASKAQSSTRLLAPPAEPEESGEHRGPTITKVWRPQEGEARPVATRLEFKPGPGRPRPQRSQRGHSGQGGEVIYWNVNKVDTHDI